MVEDWLPIILINDLWSAVDKALTTFVFQVDNIQIRNREDSLVQEVNSTMTPILNRPTMHNIMLIQ